MASVPGESTQIVYILAFLLAAAACFISLVRAPKVEDRETRYGLIGLLVGSGGWSASHAGLLVLPTADLKIAAYMIGLVLGFSTVFSWLYFCSAYSGRTLHRKPRLKQAAAALYLFVVGVKLTNPLHHQYFVSDIVRNGAVYVDIEQQAFHWMATGLAYAFAAVGLFMLFEKFSDAGYDTGPLVALTGLTVLPVILDVVGFTSELVLNIIYAPLGVAAFALGVLFVYKERFLAVQLTGDVDEAFVFLDDDGRIEDFNDAALALFPALDRSRDDPVTSVEGLDMVADSDGDVLDVTIDGEKRYFLVTDTSFTLGQADIGTVLMFSDVTGIERQRRELERHNDQLQEFAEGIRHELRNSLQVIRSRVAAAGSALDDGSVSLARESLTAASDRTGRMDRTVSDLATLAQYSQSVDGLSVVDFRRTAEAAWDGAETGDVDLVIEGDGDITADSTRLQNLFESAFEFAYYNEADSVVARLTDGGFTVTDDGTRPPDEDLDKLFDYGQAVPNAEAGMALPNVETLAEVHGWRVSIDEGYEDGIRLVVGGAATDRQAEATTEQA
jgi:signal transduction histidine kinase